jgi:DNA-binding transcriptional ArsR family regulator
MTRAINANEVTGGTPPTRTMVMGATSKMGSALLRAMSDPTAAIILNATITQGRSVEEICAQNGVPISTAYRRMHELVKEGLVTVERAIVTGDGKKYMIYRTMFSKVSVDFETGACRIEAVPNMGLPDVMYRLWQFSLKLE